MFIKIPEGTPNPRRIYQAAIHEKYGQQFEGFTQREKLTMIASLADGIKMKFPSKTREEIYDVACFANRNLSVGQRIEMIEMLFADIKASYGGDCEQSA